MADFPYTTKPASVKRFLEHIQTAGVPEKVNSRYLVKVGFKSTNDRAIIGVLKFIDFIDTSGVPTKTWQAYRNRTSGSAALAAALRKAYGDLFRTYPDAHRKDNEALRNYFSAHTKVAESTLALIVATFKALCGLAAFDASSPIEPTPVEPVTDIRAAGSTPAIASPGERVPRSTLPAAAGPAININIQLELPATNDAAIYEKLFAAMKKHLF